MKSLVLSDFTTTRLRAAELQRQRVVVEQLTRHAADVDQARSANLERSCAPAAAWREGRYGGAIVALLRQLLTSPMPVPPAPAAPQQTREMAILSTGQAGERAVHASLANLLDDAWTAISGYKNPRGEVDLIVVGPPGILALEVKALNGCVSCDGDSWWRDRCDRFGNVVETRLPIEDGRGRSPARQLNQPVDMLQAQLSRRAMRVPIHRGVVLAHSLSRVGRIANPSVHFVGLISDLRQHVVDDVIPGPNLGRLLVSRVVEVICADHHFHAGRLLGRSVRVA
jgi:hypothetical protein